MLTGTPIDTYWVSTWGYFYFNIIFLYFGATSAMMTAAFINSMSIYSQIGFTLIWISSLMIGNIYYTRMRTAIQLAYQVLPT